MDVLSMNRKKATYLRELLGAAGILGGGALLYHGVNELNRTSDRIGDTSLYLKQLNPFQHKPQKKVSSIGGVLKTALPIAGIAGLGFGIGAAASSHRHAKYLNDKSLRAQQNFRDVGDTLLTSAGLFSGGTLAGMYGGKAIDNYGATGSWLGKKKEASYIVGLIKYAGGLPKILGLTAAGTAAAVTPYLGYKWMSKKIETNPKYQQGLQKFQKIDKYTTLANKILPSAALLGGLAVGYKYRPKDKAESSLGAGSNF